MERLYMAKNNQQEVFFTSYFDNFDQIKSFYNQTIEQCLENIKDQTSNSLYFTYYNLSKSKSNSYLITIFI